MSFIEKLMERDGKEFARDIIKQYMKKNKLDTIEELLKDSPDLATFTQNTKYENYANIIRNHGMDLNEDTYKELLDMIKRELESKKQLNTEVKTYNVEGKEFTTVTDNKTGEEITFDNTVSNRSIEEQMKDVQNEHEQFQSVKENDNNTAGVMNYMKDNIKITPDTVKSDDVNLENTTEEQVKIMEAVRALEIELGHSVNVDLNSKIVYDNSIVYIIDKRDGVYQIIPVNEEENKKNIKSTQRVLTKSIGNNQNAT